MYPEPVGIGIDLIVNRRARPSHRDIAVHDWAKSPIGPSFEMDGIRSRRIHPIVGGINVKIRDAPGNKWTASNGITKSIGRASITAGIVGSNPYRHRNRRTIGRRGNCDLGGRTEDQCTDDARERRRGESITNIEIHLFTPEGHFADKAETATAEKTKERELDSGSVLKGLHRCAGLRE